LPPKTAARFDSILRLIMSNSAMSAHQRSDKLSVSHRTIQRDLAKMQEAGIIIREGDRNGGRWVICR
ncbi:MAG: HTH domain-containing protein, partial [Muribaculaceae bacterium]|nr:HTH domain-containing protein [Muribaculaceae bacterium]